MSVGRSSGLTTRKISCWESNRLSSSQIPLVLYNPKVHYRVFKSPPLVPTLSHLDSPHLPTSFFTIRSNIILPYVPKSFKWSLPFRYGNNVVSLMSSGTKRRHFLVHTQYGHKTRFTALCPSNRPMWWVGNCSFSIDIKWEYSATLFIASCNTGSFRDGSQCFVFIFNKKCSRLLCFKVFVLERKYFVLSTIRKFRKFL